MKDAQKEWILEIRKRLTDKYKNITLGQVLIIFTASSPQMDLLYEAYHSGATPQQAFKLLIERYPV